MTNLMIRVPKDHVILDKNGECYWVNLGNPEEFLRMFAIGVANPDKAVIEDIEGKE